MTDNQIMQKLQRTALAALFDRAALALTDPLGLALTDPLGLNNNLPSELTEVARHLRAQKGETVYVATWTFKNGEQVELFSTMESAQRWKEEIADEWYAHEIDETSKPTDPEELANRYFQVMGERGDEFFATYESTVKP